MASPREPNAAPVPDDADSPSPRDATASEASSEGQRRDVTDESSPVEPPMFSPLIPEYEGPPLLLRVLMLILAFACAVIAGYLCYVSLQSGRLVAGCAPGSGCDAVLRTKWAYWMGVPVSGPAAVVYALQTILLLGIWPFIGPRKRRAAWSLLLLLSVIAAGAALWFFYVQIGVLGRYCRWCSTAHTMAMVNAGLIFLTAPLRRPPAMPEHEATPADNTNDSSAEAAGESARRDSMHGDAKAPPIIWLRPATAMGSIVAGLSVMVVLVAGQVLAPTQTHAVVKVSNLQINVEAFPADGSYHAEHVFILMHDYTCPNCRKLHGFIDDARQHFGKPITVVYAIAPLSPKCNNLYPSSAEWFAPGCDYAKLAIGVWLADRSKFDAFNTYLIRRSPEGKHIGYPPPLDEARAKAEELVGKATLDRALALPLVEQTIQQGIGLNKVLREWARRMGKDVGDGVPTLVYKDHVMAGRPDTAEDFFRMLQTDLGWEPAKR